MVLLVLAPIKQRTRADESARCQGVLAAQVGRKKARGRALGLLGTSFSKKITA
jgi:hypothetical protein